MEVDNCLENQLHSWVSTKTKAPSPPGLKDLDSPGFSQWYTGNPHLPMEPNEKPIDKDLSLVVVLPGGVEKMTTVHGSKPLMDLLVTLCAKYHLNPSSHTLELVTANRNNIKLKPNALIGTLDAERILIKPKGEDKSKKTSSQMPEATVRMVINYKKTQKTILRVNPRIPLAELLPAICEKCEFDIGSTVLLRDIQSLSPLDLSSSLNDYAIREVYARNTNAPPSSPLCPASPVHAGTVIPGKDKNQKEKENKGLFSMFRKSKKNSERAKTASAPSSPVLVSKPRPLSMALPSTHSPSLGAPTSPVDTPKKRRAPPPPLLSSQSLDLSARRRFNSEPNNRLDSDQAAGLNRGSFTDSSLKRTKRKAPPPPTSPSPVVQDSVFFDENAGGAAANTLEEIMEQEEAAAAAAAAAHSVTSTSANGGQGDDSSISTSADTVTASLHSPSPDTDILSTVSAEAGEDDLSSDGKSELNQMTSRTIDSETVGTTSPDMEERSAPSCQVNSLSQQPISEGPASESVEVGRAAEADGAQDTESLAAVQENTETPKGQTNGLENRVTVNTSHPGGEDAEVQTDFTPLPVPAQQQTDPVPSGTNVPSPESPGKKDMSTLTEEWSLPDLDKSTSSDLSETSSGPDSTAGAAATTKAPSVYATDAEPKPKPSNELTRDYIPKVGMTTYTIVPPKSLEKLRYFEVALTLESPPAASEDDSTRQTNEKVKLNQETETSKENKELQSTVSREDVPTGIATTQSTVNGSLPPPSSLVPSPSTESDKTLSLTNAASQTDQPVEAKENKKPPATKPKPGSFRLSLHKKTPGYYVTSAAEKSLNTSPVSGHADVPGGAERTVFPSPPLSPSAQRQEETTGTARVRLSPAGGVQNVAASTFVRQSSLPCKESRVGLSLEKLRSFASPRPYSPSTPSRFAQAVSSAVKRSQPLSYGQKSPSSPTFSPTRPNVLQSKDSSMPRDDGSGEEENNKSFILKQAEVEPPTFPELVKLEEESCP